MNEAPGRKIDNPVGIEGLGAVESLPIWGALNVFSSYSASAGSWPPWRCASAARAGSNASR